MPSDIQNKKIATSGKFHLAHVLATGFFLQMVFVVAVLLLLSYIIADFLVTEERRKLSFQGSEISNLVGEARLKNLNHILVVAAENEKLLTALEHQRVSEIDDLLSTMFNTQVDGDLDLLVVTDEQGEIIWKIESEVVDLSPIFRHIENNILSSKRWFLDSDKNQANGAPLVFTYEKKEIVDTKNGRVRGHLIGGIILSKNFDLSSEIRERTGAEHAELQWEKKVIANTRSPANAGKKKNGIDTQAFTSNFLTSIFPDRPLQTVLYYSEQRAFSLRSAYFFSSAIAIFIVAILTALTIVFVRKALHVPVDKLVDYATEVKKRSSQAVAPHSLIVEFNKLSEILEDVFRASQDSERRFQDFADIATDSLWEKDTEGRLTFLSHRQDVTGKLPVENILGQATWDLVGVDLLYSDWEYIKESYKHQTAYSNFVFRRMGTDDSLIYWSTSGKPIYAPDGTHIGFRGTAKNITKEMEAKAEVEAVDAKLRQSQKLDAVGQLTSGIAHDFNNILGIIYGNFELLRKMVSNDDKALERIQAGLRGTERGVDITRKLLDFTRKEVAGTKRISVNLVIQEIKDFLIKSLTVSIDINFYLDDDIWLVDVDPGDFQDAIINLALNARDSMPDGGHLRIESRNKVLDEDYASRNPQGKAGEFVMVSVSDTGHGMTPETIERVLEPFFTTKKLGKGTGLGLSMVYGFVQRSGGHLKIYSEVDRGTTLNIYLPRATKKAPSIESKTLETDSHPSGTETILVVDDEDGLRDIAVLYLEELGYKARTADNGEMALKILSDGHAIDLVFSDVVMPGEIDGYELAKRAHELYPELKFLLTSGFTKKRAEIDSNRDEFLIDLNSKLLSKPYNISELAFALHNSLADYSSDDTTQNDPRTL